MVKANSHVALSIFELEFNTLKSDLKEYNHLRESEIETIFQKLLDNIPKEIADVSINQCFADYQQLGDEYGGLSAAAAPTANECESASDKHQQATKKTDGKKHTKTVKMNIENELAFDDAKEILDNVNRCSNLTSTVKKPNSIKHLDLKQKLDAVLNEQSIIQESDETERATAIVQKEQLSVANKEKQGIKLDNPKDLQNEQYKLSVIYFMKDLSQVSSKLADLFKVNLCEVHDNCVDDLLKIRKVL